MGCLPYPHAESGQNARLTISFWRSRMLGYGCGKSDRRRSAGAAIGSAPNVMMLYCGGSRGLSRVISIRRPSSRIGPGSRSLSRLPVLQHSIIGGLDRVAQQCSSGNGVRSCVPVLS
jgi:hypothetical protein